MDDGISEVTIPGERWPSIIVTAQRWGSTAIPRQRQKRAAFPGGFTAATYGAPKLNIPHRRIQGAAPDIVNRFETLQRTPSDKHVELPNTDMKGQRS